MQYKKISYIVSFVLVFHTVRSIIRVTKQRGGMYHRKRKRSTLPLLYFFYKNKQKNEGANTFRTFYRHLTGDPGGSNLVSNDTLCIFPCKIESETLICHFSTFPVYGVVVSVSVFTVFGSDL